nr:alpha/beta fold hydrolase [Oscillatoria sp. FACHB-1406]
MVLSAVIALCVALNPGLTTDAESLVLAPGEGQSLVLRIFTPNAAIPQGSAKRHAPPYPTLLLLHGINSSKSSMVPLAVELTRRGIAAITFDFRGYGESSPRPPNLQRVEDLEVTTLEDASAVLHYVRQHPERFDRQRLGVAGHSLGGETAMQLARLNPDLRATVLLSMGGSMTATSPSNVFLGVGIYEQINPASGLREQLAEAGEDCRAPEGIRETDRAFCGDFTAANARKLFVSATADHITAPYDAAILQQVVSWVQSAFAIPQKTVSIRVSAYLCALVVLSASAIASGVAFLVRSGRSVAETPQNLRLWYRRFVTGLLAFLIALMGLMGATGTAPSSGAARMMLFSYLLQLVANYALREPKKIAAAASIGSLYGSLVMAAWLLPALLCGIPELARQPADLLRLPQFVLQWPLLTLYNYLQAVRLIFFPRYSLYLSVSWLFWGLVAVELFAPGATLSAVERSGTWLVERLRRPVRFAGVGRLSGSKIALIAGLLVIFALILVRRASDGLLGKVFVESGWVLKSLGLFVMLPLGAIALMARSPFFQRWERALYNSSDL